MPTVKELKAIIDKLPDDAEVKVSVDGNEAFQNIVRIELVESKLLFGSEHATLHRASHSIVRIEV